jgi:hypothetical protein
MFSTLALSRFLSVQAKCVQSARTAILLSKMARTARSVILTRRPSCKRPPILSNSKTVTVIREYNKECFCRTIVIVVFIVVFNIACFFVDYDIVRAVWDVVNERSLSWTYHALCMRVHCPAVMSDRPTQQSTVCQECPNAYAQTHLDWLVRTMSTKPHSQAVSVFLRAFIIYTYRLHAAAVLVGFLFLYRHRQLERRFLPGGLCGEPTSRLCEQVLPAGRYLSVTIPICSWGPHSSFVAQTAIAVGAGAGILIIMPLLIYVPRLLWRVRVRSSCVGSVLVSNEQHQRMEQFTAYWTERFVFSFMLWVSFISFIAASTAINATPTPGTACKLADNSLVSGSDNEICYTREFAGTHALGVIITVALCIVFPWFQWWKCRQINYLNLEEDEHENIRYGVFWDQFAGGLRRYFCLLNFYQMTVLIATLNLWFTGDALGNAISMIVCNSIFIVFFFLLKPSQARLDDFVESYQYIVQIISLVLPIVINTGYPVNIDVSGAASFSGFF